MHIRKHAHLGCCGEASLVSVVQQLSWELQVGAASAGALMPLHVSPVIQGCCSSCAMLGRSSGSLCRQRRMKSRACSDIRPAGRLTSRSMMPCAHMSSSSFSM
jgi:hypothetical protein